MGGGHVPTVAGKDAVRIGIDARYTGRPGTLATSGGVYLRNLMRFWAGAAGAPHEFVLYYNQAAPPPVAWESPRVKVRLIPMSAKDRLWAYTRLPWTALVDRIDVLFLPFHIVPLVSPCPMVVAIHDLCFRTHPHLFTDGGRFLDRWTRFAARKAQHIIAVSQATKANLVNLYGTHTGKITVAHHGVDPAFCRLPDVEPQAPLMPRNYFVYVGTHEPRKNVSCLIHAFYRFLVQGERKECYLVLVGRPRRDTEEVQALVRTLGIEQDVVFAHDLTREALAVLYRGARALIFPTLCEGFGFPVVEAMACGTPAVLSDIPVLRELSAGAAILADPHEPRTFADAMSALWWDDALRRRLAAAAQHRARDFTWERSAARTLEAIVNAARPAEWVPASC